MRHFLLALAMFTAGATGLWALAGTNQLVGEYEPIEQQPGWPDGTHAVLLDPARKVGWCSWINDSPRDLEQYAFATRTTRDVQRLIDAFAKVTDPKRRVTFNPGRGPKGLGDFRPTAKGREWGAVLSVSNREAVANANKKEASEGKTAPYTPSPTTLEIFLGTADVALRELKLPIDLTVGTIEESPFPGRDYPEQIRKIQEFRSRGR